MIRVSLGLLAALFATGAFASSEQSWAALDATATKACMANITHRYGRDPLVPFGVIGHISGIGGPNGDQYYALTIDRNGRRGTDHWVCLYDKQTKAVSAGLVELKPR